MKLITKSVTILFLIFISFYNSLLITPLFEQTTTNPYQIIGPTTEQNYNPQNNTIRYLLVTLGTIITSYGLYILDKKHQIKYINVFIVLIVTTSFTLSQVTTFNQKVGNIDMFHDGEQLGVGSAIQFFNKHPFTEMFFLHGYFADPGIALLSFNLFGTSIGSFYFLNTLFVIISFLLLIGILSMIIKDRFLFITLSFYLIAGSTIFSFSRDLLTFLFILLIFLVSTKKISLFKGLYLSTLITSFNFLYSLDRAYYTFAANGLFIFITGLSYITKKNNLQKIQHILKIVFPTTLAISTTTIIAIIFFGWKAFQEFFIITFFKIPQMKPFLDEYAFPKLIITSLFPYWIPIILIIGSTLLSLHYATKTKWNSLSPFLITINILALLYYRSAIGRSDLHHITYVFHIIVIAAIITGSIILTSQKSTTTKLLVYILASAIFLLPYINYQKLFLPPTYKVDDIIQFITLFDTKDERWISAEQQAVSTYISQNTSNNDYIFVYTNESVYYYLFNRQNPTRFYTIWFASPNYYQQEVINDLQKNKPKLIIYKSSFWSNKIDNIPNEKRLPIIEKWIKNNYIYDKTILSTEILKQK